MSHILKDNNAAIEFVEFIWGYGVEIKRRNSKVAKAQSSANPVFLSFLEEGGAGHAFEGDYSQKGCYAYSSGEYANRAYYGLGGSDSEISSPTTNSDETYRPEGYDCVGNEGTSL